MGVLHLKIDLSEQALADLSDAVDQEPSHWLFSHAVKEGGIFQPFGQGMKLLEAVNLLRARGELDAIGGKKLAVSDLQVLPLESPEKGQIDLVIGERTRADIERCAAFIKAFNRIAGAPELGWKTPAEWVKELCLVEIAKAAARADADEIEREEKELYPSTVPAKPPTST